MLVAATKREYEASVTAIYPLLCKLVLQLTARYHSVVNCSVDNTVITNVLFWLLSVARKSNLTTLCMYQQVIAFMSAGFI